MELVISKLSLSQLLQVTQSVAEKKSTMPILANVLIEAEKGLLRITASDMEISAVATRTADVKKPGRITVSSRVFGDVVRELPDGDVTLRLGDANRLEVRCQGAVTKIIGQSADEYPIPESIRLTAKSKLPAKTLTEMIGKTVYATSQDETKYYLAGVCLEVITTGKEKALRMVATDGHRLAMITRTLPELGFSAAAKAGSTRDHVIVPRKGLLEIKKILEQSTEENVGVDVNQGYLIVESGQTKLVVRLIDGEYPEYGKVVPTKSNFTLTIPGSQLGQALRRVALMVSDKGKPVKMELEPGKLRISSSSPDLGESSEELVTDSRGEAIIVGFNARYLSEAVSSFHDSDLVTLEFDGEVGPAILKSEKDDSYLAVVMPLRVE